MIAPPAPSGWPRIPLVMVCEGDVTGHRPEPTVPFASTRLRDQIEPDDRQVVISQMTMAPSAPSLTATGAAPRRSTSRSLRYVGSAGHAARGCRMETLPQRLRARMGNSTRRKIVMTCHPPGAPTLPGPNPPCGGAPGARATAMLGGGHLTASFPEARHIAHLHSRYAAHGGAQGRGATGIYNSHCRLVPRG